MPRFVKRRRQLRTSEKAERALRRRVLKGHWVDPYPNVHGTLPEKMVYAELSARGIPFLFLNDIRFTIPEIDFDKTYQADFVIERHKLIIEVQGAHWHSMEKTIESDAFKFAIYQVKGYTVLPWWDYDILSRLQELFSGTPVLAGYAPQYGAAPSAELPVISRVKPDTSKGIRTLNQRRAQRLAYKKKAVSLRTRKRRLKA